MRAAMGRSSRSLTLVTLVSLACVSLACARPELAEPDKAKPSASTKTALVAPKAEAPAPRQAQADQPTAPSTASAAAPAEAHCGQSKPTKTYGDKIRAASFVDVAKVLDDPDKFADKPVLVQGRVRAACTAKGCWMELAPSLAKEAPGSRVTFKDYGFFVPTTSAGKGACVEGVVTTKRVSPEEVRHMESEGGRFSKKMSDGSAREVRIVATGVELYEQS